MSESKPWRVRRVGSVYKDYRSQAAAFNSAVTLMRLGFDVKVSHWEDDGWRPLDLIHGSMTPEHRRETTTPLGDGTLLADCSCGGTYSVPQGSNEYAALEAAHVEHARPAENPSATGEQG